MKVKFLLNKVELLEVVFLSFQVNSSCIFLVESLGTRFVLIQKLTRIHEVLSPSLSSNPRAQALSARCIFLKSNWVGRNTDDF